MGLLGIVKKQKLLALQNLVLNKTTFKLVMSEKQLYREAKRIANSDLKIINDCKRLVNTTVKPDVFFMRYDLLKEKAAHLSKFSPYIKFKGTPPSIMIIEIHAKDQAAISDFLKRYYNSVIEKSKTLKTEKAKNNQLVKFYDSLQPYYNKMNKENIQFIEDRKPSSLTTA